MNEGLHDRAMRKTSTSIGCIPLLSRVLTVIAFGFALMLLAATGVQAHAGHDHASHAAPVGAHHHATDVSAPRESGPIVAANFATGQSVSAPVSRRDQPQSAGLCAGGCCHHSGAGCCGASLPPTISLAHPSKTRFGLAPRA